MIDISTRRALRARLTGSMCQLAKELQIPVATLSDIIAGRHEHVSLQSENRVRERLGLEPLRPPIQLLHDEKIIKLKPPHQRDRRRCLHVSPELYQRINEQRGELSHEEYLARSVELWEAHYASKERK